MFFYPPSQGCVPRGNSFLTLIQNYEDSKTCCERQPHPNIATLQPYQ